MAEENRDNSSANNKTSGIENLEAFRDKYRITSTYSQYTTRFPIKETMPKEELEFHTDRLDILGDPIPFPETTLQSRSSECYLFIDTSAYKKNKAALYKQIFPPDTPTYVGDYYTNNDAGLGIWEFIITDVNIQHLEANITTKVVADTIINHSAGATPITINITGYLLEDMIFDHVYNITYMFENVLRATNAHNLGISIYIYIFGVYYKLELGDILFNPGVNQGGYTPFRLAAHGFNTSIDPAIMSKQMPERFSYMTRDEQLERDGIKTNKKAGTLNDYNQSSSNQYGVTV